MFSKKSRRTIVFFILLFAAAVLFATAFIAVLGNTEQVFKDITIEIISYRGSNKSIERRLLYLLIAAGTVICAIYQMRANRSGKDAEAAKAVNSSNDSYYTVTMILTVAVIMLAVNNSVNPLLVISCVWIAVLLIARRASVSAGLAFFFLTDYSVYGIYWIYALLGGTRPLSTFTAALVSLAISAAVLFSGHADERYRKGCLIAQIFIPASLFAFLQSAYLYQGQTVRVYHPVQVTVFIAILFVIFEAIAVKAIKDQWKGGTENSSFIMSAGTVISIIAYNCVITGCAVMPTDMHHPFENIIGYSQVFQLHRSLFSQYVPISGMFSIVHGAIFQFFGGGAVGNYYSAENIFYLIFIIVTGLLLTSAVRNNDYLLLITLLFAQIRYNRVVVMLPMILLLVQPGLIKRKNLWIQLWLVTSLFYGLYYPVMGAAVCAGFLPMAVYLAYRFIRDGELRISVRKVTFWLGWAVCAVLLLVNLKNLAGTFSHIMAMGGQSVLGNGITRFGQVVPDTFFPYVKDQRIRRVIYYSLTYVLPALLVWVSIAFGTEVSQLRIENRKIRCGRPVSGLMAVSMGILAAVAYTYTFTRLDIGSVYARSEGIIIACGIGLIVMARLLTRSRGVRMRMIIVVSALISFGTVGFLNNDDKMTALTEVPEGYVYVEDDDSARWGTGFARQDIYDSVEQMAETPDDPDASYVGTYPYFGYFYLLDVPGDAELEMSEDNKSYDAVAETVSILKNNQTVVGTNLDPYANYYLFNWLLTSGQYEWSPEDGRFYYNGGDSTEDVLDANRDCQLGSENGYILQTAGSLGNSFESLRPIFEEPDIGYSLRTDEEDDGDDAAVISFDQAVDGDEADFLYLEFSGLPDTVSYSLYDLTQETADGSSFLTRERYNADMTVIVTWTDDEGAEHTMSMDMCKGRLLIPLGAGKGWLLNSHDSIEISVQQNGTEIVVPDISEAAMLKLREVE